MLQWRHEDAKKAVATFDHGELNGASNWSASCCVCGSKLAVIIYTHNYIYDIMKLEDGVGLLLSMSQNRFKYLFVSVDAVHPSCLYAFRANELVNAQVTLSACTSSIEVRRTSLECKRQGFSCLEKHIDGNTFGFLGWILQLRDCQRRR